MARTPSADVDSSAFQVASISVVGNGATWPVIRHPSMNPPSKVLFSSFISRCSSRSLDFCVITSSGRVAFTFLFGRLSIHIGASASTIRPRGGLNLNWYPDSRGHSAPTYSPLRPPSSNPRREFSTSGINRGPQNTFQATPIHARGFPSNLVASQPIAKRTTTMAVGSRSARPNALSTAITPAKSTTS